MLKKLARDLAYAIDGMNIVQYKAGDDIEVLDHHVNGLSDYFASDGAKLETKVIDDKTIDAGTNIVTDEKPADEPAKTDEPAADANPERTKVVIMPAEGTKVTREQRPDSAAAFAGRVGLTRGVGGQE